MAVSALALSTLYACSNNSVAPVKHNPKITIVKGANSSDTIQTRLFQALIVEVALTMVHS